MTESPLMTKLRTWYFVHREHQRSARIRIDGARKWLTSGVERLSSAKLYESDATGLHQHASDIAVAIAQIDTAEAAIKGLREIAEAAGLDWSKVTK